MARGQGSGKEVMSLLGHWFERSVRQARRLFHMLVGLAFMALGAAGLFLTVSEWVDYRRAPTRGWGPVALFGGFTVLLAVLCLYSFVRSRSVR